MVDHIAKSRVREVVVIGTGRVFWLSPMLMKTPPKADMRRPVPIALNPFFTHTLTNQIWF